MYEFVAKGFCPVLDSYVERTVLFSIPSNLSAEQRTMILDGFDLTCKKLNLKKGS